MARTGSPHGVGHGGAGLAHPLGCLLLRHAVLLHQNLVALGLLDGIQILPLEVLNHGQLHGLAVIGFDDHGGHLRQSGHTGGTPAPLTGDDLIVPGLQLPHRQRLDDAVLTNGISQIGQRVGVEQLAGLRGTGFHLADGQHQTALFIVQLHHVVAHQSAEALA